jgi:predicted Zn-dependent peptidase
MSYTDTGVFSIYFGTDATEADRCIELTLKELDRLRERPLTTLQLSAAKKQLMGQVGVASDHFENTALGMAKTYLHYGEYEGQEALFRRIEALTTDELWNIAGELFRRDNLSVLIYR